MSEKTMLIINGWSSPVVGVSRFWVISFLGNDQSDVRLEFDKYLNFIFYASEMIKNYHMNLPCRGFFKLSVYVMKLEDSKGENWQILLFEKKYCLFCHWE